MAGQLRTTLLLGVAASLLIPNILDATPGLGSLAAGPAEGHWVHRHSAGRREDEVACGWPNLAPGCRSEDTILDPVILNPGHAYIVDDFLDESEFAWLDKVFDNRTLVLQGDSLNTTWEEVDFLPPGWDALVEALVQRIHGHAVAHIRSTSALQDSWRYRDTFYPDHWLFRKYHGGHRMQVHQDTGNLGRCLSAAVHIGRGANSCCEGGTFQTFRCRSGNCSRYGWQFDSGTMPATNNFLLRDENLDVLAQVPYRPGRLVYFLAETLHGVTEITQGDRIIFFVWLSCSPTLANGVISNGHLAVVEHLVAQRAPVGTTNPNTGLTSIHSAALGGHVPILEFLAAHSEDIGSSDKDGAQPLHRASDAGHLPVVETLARLRADIEAVENDGTTPMYWAVQKGHMQVIESLFRLGASARTDGAGRLLLSIAAEYGHCPSAEFLVRRAGVDANITEVEKGIPPLHVAAARGHLIVAECLLELGADAAGTSDDGAPPLHPAAAMGHVAMAQYLIDKEADASKTDHAGVSALHWAAENGHLEVVKHLVERGESHILTTKDAEGSSAYDRAKGFRHSAVARYLLSRAEPAVGKDRAPVTPGWQKGGPAETAPTCGSGAMADDGACWATAGSGGPVAEVGIDADAQQQSPWKAQTISVVLPCAGEGKFAQKTVKAVHVSTPREVLREIIVVDDGSEPPLAKKHLTKKFRKKYGVQLVRHEDTVGISGAKKSGGDAANGDVVVFFDCHVAPSLGWHEPFLRLISQNYRRIVVPEITDLDIDTWQQRQTYRAQGPSHSKCYLTWDADFKWFTPDVDSDDDISVPVLSGGLLGISRRWWNDTAGYDPGMAGWGGENIDQSLRCWLCGGEIVRAKDAFVAHMWRKSEDPRTTARYKSGTYNVIRNRLRAVAAWFGDFKVKLNDYPHMMPNMLLQNGEPWYGDINSILEVKHRLKCRSLAWFMHRFRDVYVGAGLIPKSTFSLQSGRLCLTYLGMPGTSPDGYGTVALRPCNSTDDRQRWHNSNQNRSTPDRKCCLGLRAWNTDQCLQAVNGPNRNIFTTVCEVTGRDRKQWWNVNKKGGLLRWWGGTSRESIAPLRLCAEPSGEGIQMKVGCNDKVWSVSKVKEPVERALYRKWLQDTAAKEPQT